MKICNKCNIEKPSDELVKRSGSSDGYRSLCKSCYNKYKKEKRKNRTECEKEKGKKYFQNYRKLNYIRIIENERKYQQINKEKEFIRKQKYREENREKCNESVRKYKKLNNEKIRESAKKYYQNNKNKRRVYEESKRKNDCVYRISNSLRSRINVFVKTRKINKNNKTFNVIGLTPIELKEHMEKQFTQGMSWDNYGEWHIDHIIPLSFAKTEEDVYKLCHHTNLQPLWAEDNLKKSNKIIKQTI